MKENLKTFVSKFITDAVFGGIAAIFVCLIADKVLVPFIFDIAKTTVEMSATLVVGAVQAAEMSKELTAETIGGIGGTLIHFLRALKPHIAFSLLFGTRFTVAYITGNYKYEKEVNHAR